MKKINIKNTFQMTFFYVIILGLLFLPRTQAAASMPVNKRIIAIDAGHGEWDPGKEKQDIDEKDINLVISDKLQTMFEIGGAVVITTRSDDTALADRKRDDLTARASIANAANADIYLSIHQNSFQNASVNGAQVFYHPASENSKLLADFIQDKFNTFVKDHHGNPRTRSSEASDVYFVLRKTEMPAVIIECSFMTNAKDLALIQNEEYQEKVVWAIYTGVSAYFEHMNALQKTDGTRSQ